MKKIYEQKNLFCLPWAQTIPGTHERGTVNFIANLKTAPMIVRYPLTIKCRVTQTIDLLLLLFASALAAKAGLRARIVTIHQSKGTYHDYRLIKR